MKIIIATGGSGGHLIPAIKVAEALREQGHAVVFLGTFGSLAGLLTERQFEYAELPARGLVTHSLTRIFLSAYFMLKSIGQATRHLARVRPDRVAGFGGYGAFPVVTAAILRRIPVLIHEQNVCPGRANRLLARFVKKVAISFDATRPRLAARCMVTTGCPCRQPDAGFDRDDALRRFGLRAGGWTVLICGGSQGSRRINELLMQVAPRLQALREVQLIHVAGSADASRVAACYQQQGIPHAVFAFLKDMETAYGLADVAVARAGAVTVSELAAFGLPAVLIPYPHAGGHQRANAQVLVEAGLARMIDETDLSAEGFLQALAALVPAQRTPRGPAAVDPARRIAEEILAL